MSRHPQGRKFKCDKRGCVAEDTSFKALPYGWFRVKVCYERMTPYNRHEDSVLRKVKEWRHYCPDHHPYE